MGLSASNGNIERPKEWPAPPHQFEVPKPKRVISREPRFAFLISGVFVVAYLIFFVLHVIFGN